MTASELPWLVSLLALGCGPVRGEPMGTTGQGTETGETSTTGTPTSTSGAASEGASSGSAGATELPGFTFWPDAGDGKACDLWAQDCPEGQKCVVYGSERGVPWDGWKCVAVVDDPGGPNDPCVTMDAWNSGLDTCEKGTMCWQYGGEGLAGICLPLCGGSRAEPSCSDPSQYCRILGDDDLTPYLCFTQCDPVAQDCPAAQVCRPDYYWNLIFSCYAQGGGADGLFAACTAASCQPGLVCLPADTAVECDPGLEGCCTPYCDLDAPACPGAGQACIPWFSEPAPPGYAALGVCMLP